MNETNNVCGVVFHDYSKLFNKIKEVKTLFKNEFIYGGHWLSLGVSTFTVALMFLIGVSFKFELLLIVYFLSQSVYNYDHFKWIEIDATDNPKRTNYLSKNYVFIPAIILFYTSMFFILLSLYGNFESLIFGGLLLLLGVIYTNKAKKLTTKIPGFKNYYTSISASLLVVFIALYCAHPLNLQILVLVLFVFLCFLVNTSFCDLKDLNADKKQGLITLPLYFGEKRFLQTLHILNALTFLMLALSIILGILPPFASILLIFYFYCFYYIQKARRSKTNFQYLSTFFADGEFILWPIFLFLGKMAIFGL
jgi:4-hydroxybenzoate polyprenyltransferase